MEEPDLADVRHVTDTAFARIIGQMTGRTVTTPVMPPLLFSTRFAADPAGCWVAGDDTTSEIVGAVFSIARGTLGWFGPLAVSPAAQGQGVGRELIAACLEGLRRRGVRLIGLETFAESPFHVRLYSRFGFRPSWTGLGLRRKIEPVRMPADVTTDGAGPNLDYVYAGLDVHAEAAMVARCAVGTSFVTEGGIAICHFAPTFEGAGTGFLPFVAASSQPAFDRLLDAAEHACGERGLGVLAVRVSGSAWRTFDRLVARGYRAERAEIRMKLGERPDYDASAIFYADSWL
jgi:GNAT superfamily N-acetyltransferase